jgi:hypothetical protein
LSSEAKGLHSILSELHDIGVLLLLGDQANGDCHVVLKCSKLTNEVHKSLFSVSAVKELALKCRETHDVPFNVGIIPDAVLQEILPPHITMQCLRYLQYCQEIKCADISVFKFTSVVQPSSLHEQQDSVFFFPALCNVGKSDVAWATQPDIYSIGWLAQCTDSFDYFPPRFLHVLLLRLVFRFTLSAHTADEAVNDHSFFQRRCTMWKTGVHWLMREGVECEVELVNGNNREVRVVAKTDEDSIEKCVSVFHRVLSCVMEAKAEFCHSIRPRFFLLDSTSEADSLNKSNLFDMSEVEEVLTSPQGYDAAVSIDGKGRLKRARLMHFRKLTYWNDFFPMQLESILRYLQDLVTEVYETGLELKVPVHCLETLCTNYPTDVSKRRKEMVREWLNTSLDPPCWWHLVRALRAETVGRRDIADSIKTALGMIITAYYNRSF